MDEKFTIQCDNCGTVYDNEAAICPECGHPPPLIPPEEQYQSVESEESVDELSLTDELYRQTGLYDDEAVYPTEDFYPDDPYLDETEDYLVDSVERDYMPDAYNGSFYPAAAPPSDYAKYEYEYDTPPSGVPIVAAPQTPARSRWRTLARLTVGCLTVILCAGFFYLSIGVFAVYSGYNEQLTEVETEVEARYSQGLSHLEAGNYERAIAEFNYVLTLNPNFSKARQSLQEAQVLMEQEPTATSPSRASVAASLFAEAEKQVTDRQWAEVVQTLTRLRDLDLSYQTDRVSEMLYTANYQLGLQQLRPDFIDQAVLSFERALEERPGDPKAETAYEKAQLYAEAQTALQKNKQKSIEIFADLYELEPQYLDVADRLWQTHELLGDDLALQGKWCQAETHYAQALILEPSDKLQTKVENSGAQCAREEAEATETATDQETPADTEATSAELPAQEFATPKATVTPTDTVTGAAELNPTQSTEELAPTPTQATEADPTGPGGTIIYSAFNKDEDEWHILEVPASGGQPKFVVRNGIMPAISADGRYLVYRSQAKDAEGLHAFDFHTGQDKRITILRQDILPRFGADNAQYLFTAQEPATGRWLIHQGFTDGLGQPEIVGDGQTPDWAVDGAVAFHTTTPDGNNPGIYLAPAPGLSAEQLTTHRSDRLPDFSPDGSQIAYMSTQSGNWDIYIVGRDGGTPRQLTTYPGNDGLPVWSPDGSHLAYVSDQEGAWAIYTISAAGGTPNRVTAWPSLQRADWLMSQIAWANH